MNSNLLPFVFSPISSFENPCLKILLDGLVNLSHDKIIITDKDYRVLFSNFPIALYGENAIKKLKINRVALGEKFKRSFSFEGQKTIFEITVNKLIEEELNCEMYIFFLKDITSEEKYRKKFEKLVGFLKHELTTPLISQILALKLVLKSEKNKLFLPEILHSSEVSYRILKNCIEEVDFEENKLKIKKNEFQLKQFVDRVMEGCQGFLSAKKTMVETNIVKKSRVFADEILLKKSIENILFQINERCVENSKIIFKAELSHNNLRFEILAPYEIEYDDMFCFKTEKLYTKLAHNNGLFIAEKIIKAHGGRILIQKRCDRTSLKIILPN